MAETNAISSSALPTLQEYQDSLTRTPKNSLEKNDFLNLLVSQMKYQNPLEPQTDTAFVAQLAQFSSLEQMTNLTSSMGQYQAYSMAGKYIYAEARMEDGTTVPVAGFVDAVVNKDGVPYLQVGDIQIKASAVQQVIDASTVTGDNPLLSNVSLIGRYVEGKTVEPVYDTNGKLLVDENGAAQTVEVSHAGVVVRVAVDSNHGMVAYLADGDRLPLANIADIRSEAPEAEAPVVPETPEAETAPEAPPEDEGIVTPEV
jgi:flagellar basal-body rod modification protein FlgD